MKKPKASLPNHIRAWRKFRGLKQAALAERIGTTSGMMSLLETGGRELSADWIMRIAEALDTRPGHLLEYDPNEVDVQILDLWAKVPAERRAHAEMILSTFVANDDVA